MLQVYKNKEFNKWARKHGISDKQLYDAALEINLDIYDANLGGNVYKKRIAIPKILESAQFLGLAISFLHSV